MSLRERRTKDGDGAPYGVDAVRDTEPLLRTAFGQILHACDKALTA